MKNYDSIEAMHERIKAKMCEEYCRYPKMEIPEGKDEAWLLEKDSPCVKCPLNYL